MIKRSYIRRKYGKKKKPPDKNSIAWLKKELWKIFSRYIRHRDHWTCFTCGRFATGSGLHAGHYIPKSIGGILLYFNEYNVHAQCYHCNINLSGNSDIYLQRLEETYGSAVLEEIRALRRKETQPWTAEDYKTKIEYYKAKVKEFENVERKANRQ